jgi:hypothetical protein
MQTAMSLPCLFEPSVSPLSAAGESVRSPQALRLRESGIRTTLRLTEATSGLRWECA